jgi:hypothetical protein
MCVNCQKLVITFDRCYFFIELNIPNHNVVNCSDLNAVSPQFWILNETQITFADILDSDSILRIVLIEQIFNIDNFGLYTIKVGELTIQAL